MTTAPLDVVSARLEIIHGAPPAMRARCPAHGSKGGTLAIKATANGTVLLKCHAGCTLDDVLLAAGLSAGDLFPGRAGAQVRERIAARRRFAKSPEATVRDALTRELDRLRARLRAELGYDRPIRSSDINSVRAHVAGIYEVKLPPVPAFAWECPPHDDDPAWPTLYLRALEEQGGDPRGPTLRERLRAERLARVWQRSLAS
jgi:hypothetical protein